MTTGEPYYRGAAARFYDCLSTGLEGDIAFYVERAREAEGPVLELGCGTGRILAPIAEAGCAISGLDLSADMLEQARARLAAMPPGAATRATLERGDMRDFDLGRRFALAIIPYRAFAHLMTPGDQMAGLARIRAHLEPGGRLVMNTFDPSLPVIAAHLGPGAPGLVPMAAFPHPDTGNTVQVWATRRYEPAEQVVGETRVFEELDASGRTVGRLHTRVRLRYTFRFEMQHLLERCGFTIEDLHGDFAGGPFSAGGEQVWFARAA